MRRHRIIVLVAACSLVLLLVPSCVPPPSIPSAASERNVTTTRLGRLDVTPVLIDACGRFLSTPEIEFLITSVESDRLGGFSLHSEVALALDICANSTLDCICLVAIVDQVYGL